MLGYQPLCREKNEIRLVTILPPTITKGSEATEPGALEPLQCVLEHLSLDDYSPGYADFLETDALALPAHLQQLLWQIITRAVPEDVVEITTSPQLASNAIAQSLAQTLPVLIRNPKYQDKEKYNESATRWEWGDYDALSYVWGDPTITRKIIVNGHEVNVTENLEDALRSLQRRLDDHGGRRLWVDALCINQTDIPERNVQVKRMATIYENADTVIAWLGCETDASKSAFRFIRRHVETAQQTSGLEIDFIKSLRENQDCLRKETWKGLIDLIYLPYWSRAWIIQELQLANTRALLVWGNQECLLGGWFRVLLLFMEYLSSKLEDQAEKLYPNDEGRKELFFTRMMQSTNLSTLDRYKYDGTLHPNLMMLLDTGRRAETFDDRDKIYALLGLMKPTLSETIIPDYGATEIEVYRNFSRAVIEESGKLSIICQDRSNTIKQKDLPSWVVDWRLHSDRGPILECGEQLYRAAGDSKHDYESDGDESHLVCKGLKFDTVGGLGCDIFSPGNVVPSRITREPVNPYTDDEGIRTALWESFLLGRMTSFQPHVAAFLKSIPWLNRTADGNSSFIPFYGSFDRFQQYNRTLEIAGKSLEYYFPEQSKEFEITPPETWDIGVESALFNSLCPMTDMRLMTTRKGYVGFAPKLSQRGDIICVLQGCNIPVVLRPCGEIYNLVGECYIHGIMEGETVVGLEKGEYELETITLC